MPFGLYIHIPFCEVKCGYCDFYSVARGFEDFDLQKQYVDQLLLEIQERSPVLGGRFARSIFFGGGTPSLMEPSLLEKILTTLAKHFSWGSETEITLETNPKTVSLEKLKAFRSLGINRISLGGQSFDDGLLKTLGRIHSGDEARQTLRDIRTAGFKNLSLDLIFALPGQTFDMWQKDLEMALTFETPHLSCYHLTLEGGTPFERLHRQGSLSLPEEDDGIRCLTWTRERLSESGMSAYEISNFSRVGFESVHNRNYWHYGEYLGLGTAAASFVRRKRRTNVRDLKKYLSGDWEGFSETLDEETARGEFCWLALRTREGISRKKFEEEFGKSFDSVFWKILENPIRRGWLQDDGESLKLTEPGILQADGVGSGFLFSTGR